VIVIDRFGIILLLIPSPSSNLVQHLALIK